MKLTIQKNGERPQGFSLEPSTFATIDLITGEAKPTTLEIAKEALKRLNTALLRVPGASEALPSIFMEFNLPEGQTPAMWVASQHTEEHRLISQGFWEGPKTPHNTLWLQKNQAGKIIFPEMTVELSWAK